VILILFVNYRLRQGKEQDRDATLAALVCRTFRDHTMIFVRTKADAHRVKILLGLFGLKVKFNIKYCLSKCITHIVN